MVYSPHRMATRNLLWYHVSEMHEPGLRVQSLRPCRPGAGRASARVCVCVCVGVCVGVCVCVCVVYVAA